MTAWRLGKKTSCCANGSNPRATIVIIAPRAPRLNGSLKRKTKAPKGPRLALLYKSMSLNRWALLKCTHFNWLIDSVTGRSKLVFEAVARAEITVFGAINRCHAERDVPWTPIRTPTIATTHAALKIREVISHSQLSFPVKNFPVFFNNGSSVVLAAWVSSVGNDEQRESRLMLLLLPLADSVSPTVSLGCRSFTKPTILILRPFQNQNVLTKTRS